MAGEGEQQKRDRPDNEDEDEWQALAKKIKSKSKEKLLRRASSGESQEEAPALSSAPKLTKLTPSQEQLPPPATTPAHPKVPLAPPNGGGGGSHPSFGGLGGGMGGDDENDFDDVFGDDLGGMDDFKEPETIATDVVEMKDFVRRATSTRQLLEEDFKILMETMSTKATSWLPKRRWRSLALLIALVSRSSRIIRGDFIATGLPLLGELLQQAVGQLESKDPAERQEAGMWALACLICLRALALGRATLWEHKNSLGKPFDKLHKWCGRERTALAAELRVPTNQLCQRWKKQPKPVGQGNKEEKAMREKVIDMIDKGLQGIAGTGGNMSPASPMVPSPSAGSMPSRLVATEVEAALYARFTGAGHEYKSHARMLRSNLAHHENGPLRSKVLTGEIPPEELAKMDSHQLAPQSLQEIRRKIEQESMKEVIIEDLIPKVRSKDDEYGQGYHSWYTAPPVFVKSPMHPSRTESWASDPGEANPSVGAGLDQERKSKESIDKTEENEKDKSKSSKADEDAAAMPPPTPLHLEPAPTPFQVSAMTPIAPGTIEASPLALATPLPEEDDEELDTLVHYLSRPV
mmetsp:Transcript_78660/g.163557  ORF Transcript_78660/g.163557 Transcript_78660/m.163557 type:complete len:577 (-) Transcript_78660:75-1805(-)|eukprot:CAMPEP_0206491444 /NCGR_PEP_ID=MMETSP0324_2-20121206/45003_1 /ASSEMBLY_ACC=CAM_ASM_000836 /TAXON_ID=2866 /ORGANISM="Crypthecodinium cohnii, Strain Seligo" /LENGTH=576 /DNA_ID=CAMNT_0053972643 /DNA_START=293 /DNA_END=2023 /DNA_ORIENTATION=+